jgi:hypothetical protein
MKFIRLLASMFMLAVLAACSGGGGNPGATVPSSGTVPNSTATTAPTTPTTTATASVNDLVITLDKTQVNNNAATQIELQAQAVDAGRNAVIGAAGTIEIQDVSGGAAASGGPFVTDVNGKFKAQISIGASKINRAVTVKVKVNGLERNTLFSVVGSKLQLSLSPATPAPGETVTLEVTAQDSSNSGIANEVITLNGLTGINGLSKVTDAQGKAAFTFLAPSTGGTYNLQLQGLGVNANKSFAVVSPGGVGQPPPPAAGNIVSNSLAANPTVIGVNEIGKTINRAQLRALFLTNGNVPLQNVRVRFDIVPGPSGAVLGGGESISIGNSVVYTDAAGAAYADYISGIRSSPNNGVVVRACYDVNDFAAGTCPQSTKASFTVASTPLSLTLGDNNELEKADANTTYIKKFVLIVSDSAGQPVPNAQVSFSVDIYKYGKGVFGLGYAGDGSIIVTDVNGTTRTLAIFVNPPNNPVDDVFPGRNTWCAAEDLNRNGSIDSTPTSSEDRNGNNSLEPRGADIVISSDSPGNRTDSNGVLLIKVRYPQNVATWLAYAVKATALADGSEGTVTKTYRTSFVVGDDANGSFKTAPYGASFDCTSPN